MENVVIIGSGPAGLTAAIYLARSGVSPVVICGNNPGGQLMNTSKIENYPGIESMNGSDLMVSMIKQAENLGTRLVYETTSHISISNGCFSIKQDNDKAIDAKALLIATGAKHKHLNIPGEAKFTNKGVSWCATCDGAMYRGQSVAVIGGGNTAVMEALFLSTIAEKVYLIHRRDTLRAEEIMQKRLFEKKNIELVWNSEVKEIKGEKKVSCIILNNERKIDLSVVFISVGTIPATDIAKDVVELDQDGYIVSHDTKTSIPGIFVAGDVESGSLKQAIYAAGRGALAANKIEQYLGVR